LLLGAEAGGGEVRGACDDSAWLVLAPTLGEENVDLRVQALGRVSADREFAGDDVFDEAEDALLDLRAVLGFLDVALEAVLEVVERLRRVGEEE